MNNQQPKPINGQVFIEVEVKDRVQKIGSVWAVEEISKERGTAFDPVHGIVRSGEHEGKTAFFHKLCYKQCLRGQDKAILELDGKTILVIDESDVFFYVNYKPNLTDSQAMDDAFNYAEVSIDFTRHIEMKEQWCLCEVPDDTWEIITEKGMSFMAKKTSSGIYIGKIAKNQEETIKCKIAHIHPKISEELNIFAGDLVLLDKACDIKAEDELTRQLDKQYFRVNVQNILAKYD